MSDDKIKEGIWANHRKEINYWVREFLDGYNSKNISIHEIEECEVTFTLIFDPDDASGVLMQTSHVADTVEESHRYMFLDRQVIEKIVECWQKSPKIRPVSTRDD